MGREPYENARVLLSHSKEQYIARLNGIPCQYDAMTQHSKSEWTEKLDDILGLLLFGFNIFQSIDGMHCNLPGATIAGITMLSIRKLDILLNGTKLTIGERCIMHVYIAVTLVHEITHAITMSRMMRLVPGEVQSEPLYGFQEPIVDCEGISEIGEWFEGQVFGGLCWAHDIPISASLLEVPSLLRFVEKFAPGAWMNSDSKSKMYYIPTSWHSRIMSEDFWNAAGVPQKSENFFHRPSMFVNESLSVGMITGNWEQTQAIYPDPQIDTYDEDERIVQHWHNRHNTWKYLRAAWYDDQYFQWKYSPWFHLTGRWEIETFAEAFADRDEVGCAVIAQQMADRVGWRRDLATFNQYIPQVGGNCHPDWVFHCIGLLMMAAIPIREKTIEREDKDQWKTVILTPSRNMVTTYGLENDFILEEIQSGSKKQTHAGKSELFDHVNGRGQIEDGFTQLDYLDLAADVVSRVTSQTVVHFSWINAINSAIQKLSEDRLGLQTEYPDGHADKWASDWTFETPKYDKERGVYNADGSTRLLRFDAVSQRYTF
ncbi:hypothetical protein F4679DRAFT_189769 [Xylaria curta]|nr:hypothetical protein F4679DRAFT_189769 [Xylaria curta]